MSISEDEKTTPQAIGLQKWREEHPEGARPTRTPWEKIRENLKSKKSRMDAFCANCMGWEVNGDRPARLVADIRDCDARQCPLWDVRPYRNEGESSYYAEPDKKIQ